jgi:hypothetical protein
MLFVPKQFPKSIVGVHLCMLLSKLFSGDFEDRKQNGLVADA